MLEYVQERDMDDIPKVRMRHGRFILSVLLTTILQLDVVRSDKTTTQNPTNMSKVDTGYELKRTPEQIETALKKHKIIPDLLDKAPNETIYLEYIDGPRVLLGNEISKIDALECRPMWVNYRIFLEEKHTMIMLGLDEPSPKNRSSSLFLYWLVGNIPPHDWENVPAMDYVAGDTIVDYREPRPLKETGLHRYVFLIYAHKNKTIKFSIPKLGHRNITARLNFKLKDFVKKHDLGQLYAINFFVAQWQPPPVYNSTDAPITTVPFDQQNRSTTYVIEHWRSKSGHGESIRMKVKEK